MKVLIFQSGESLQIDENPNPMRAINLSNYLSNLNFEVYLWSAKFNHHTKTFRQDKFDNVKKNNILIKLIDSIGYKKNVSVMRIFDHLILSRNLNKELVKLNFKPDFVFIGYPPIETAWVISKWCAKNNIPYCLDVKDNWPEFFLDKFPKKFSPIIYLIFFPYFVISKKLFYNSLMISSISKTFLKWSHIYSKRKKVDNDKVYYLLKPKKINVVSNNVSDQIHIIREKYSNDCFPLLFVGNHYHSLDLVTIILGTKKLNNKNNNKFKLFLCGDGETTKKLKQIANRDKNIHFLGRVNDDEILVLSRLAKIFLCPYKNIKAFQMSLPNKVLDAFRLNLPIVTSFDKGETFELLKKNKIDFIYRENCPKSFEEKVTEIYKMPDKEYQDIKKKINEIYLKKFDYEKNNKSFLDHVKKVLKNEN